MTKEVDKKTHTAICQLWEESERGWGCRPDGYSLHKGVETCIAYVTEYWAGMPDSVQTRVFPY